MAFSDVFDQHVVEHEVSDEAGDGNFDRCPLEKRQHFNEEQDAYDDATNQTSDLLCYILGKDQW